MKIVKAPFDHKNVYEYTLINDFGVEVSCLNYGCIITKILTPDNFGNLENIVLRFESMGEYEQNPPFLGAVIGRVAGRIKGAEFELDGKAYQLEKNEGENHLHGGNKGFNTVLWDAELIEGGSEIGVRFSYTSPDGEEGYPGVVSVHVNYLLSNNNELLIKYEAVTDQKTLLNLTNHTYFNLSGNAKRDVLEHSLTLDSNQFLELNEQLLPTGVKLDAVNTVFDFQNGRLIKDGTVSNHPQNQLVGKGYDHPFLLNSHHTGEIVLSDEVSGRKLIVETDQPSVVLYTGNSLTEDVTVNGRKCKKHLGLCLETQGLPDAIHHPSFPTIILDKGETYSAITKYTFITE
ncbi:aldose epimerase family protein [Neobacillus sp. PS3-40]|uniref:aldose epimerase family protein n=1 Tax=Neobacillus sp. PS3-40 TaxID=3070679 RepID=UPI0027E1D0DF|nr:aldose epimerase family protein [Neobacillus sp. PS3-40]WML42878.1 aldose epimerase family protein [Neobacillus sp. PS3-40]